LCAKRRSVLFFTEGKMAIKAVNLSFLLSALALIPVAEAKDYIVVDFVGQNDPYYAAASRLAELRSGEIISADTKDISSLLNVFRQKQPRYVALVLRPEQFDINLAKSFLKLATQVDDDPFVDFAYGFITGDSPEVAVALAERASQVEKERRQPTIGLAAVGDQVVTQSSVNEQTFLLRKGTLPQLWGQIAGGENFPGIGRDTDFIKLLMPQLQGKSIIMFAGHGYPREVVGGPTWKDLAGLKFDGAVALNIACLTGVTGKWYDEDWKQGKKVERLVPKEQSFCLGMLRTGVGAYVAYACPRPAGPELFADIAALAAEGLSVGEVRRRDYNRVVLASLAQGRKGLVIKSDADGERLRPPRDLVNDLLLDMATGGVVFGDPQFTPFTARPDEIPAEFKTQSADNGLLTTIVVRGEHLFFECSDQLAIWKDDAPAMRVLAIVPLGRDYVRAVQVKELKMGDEAQAYRLVWAVEENRGERFVNIKVNFPMPGVDNQAALTAGVQAALQIETTNDQSKSRSLFVSREAAR
jgi:hypothetical protein